MLKDCPVQLGTVYGCEVRVWREAAEQAGSPLQITSSGQEKASQPSSGEVEGRGGGGLAGVSI